ncbi:MAG TPA: DUF4012 domain-containing protein [Actinocrinis sp.]|nr:DUF4012 domain-containing protein [Actinocrinis sp.]
MKKRTRVLLYCAVPAAILFLAAAGWLRNQALAAGRDLTAAQSDTARLRVELAAGDLAAARRLLTDDMALTSDARRRASGVLWSATSAVPIAGRGARAVQGMAEAADRLTHKALPELIDAIDDVRRAQGGQPGARIDLHGLSASGLKLDAASRTLNAVTGGLDRLPHSTGISGVDIARSAFYHRTAIISAAVAQAAGILHELPSMLGCNGTRRYFLAIQTNAEARGTGGLVGAYGIVAADHGVLRFERFGSDDDIPPVDTTSLNAASPITGSPNTSHTVPRIRVVARAGPHFGAAPTYDRAWEAVLLAESNLSPDFPAAAGAWTAQWRRVTGERLDGAIAVDPVGLADLLDAVGAVELPDGERISSRNAVSTIEQGEYARFPDPVRRKRFLVLTARTVAAAFESRPAPSQSMLRALREMVDGGRLRVWSADQKQQAVLSATALGGALRPEPGPFVELVTNNAAGTKLDYYLDRDVDYTLGPCSDGRRRSEVRIVLRNDAPSSGLPGYVVSRSDAGSRGRPAGSNKLRVSLYAAVGARLSGAQLDGRPVSLSPGVESRHPVFSTMVELAAGQSRVLKLALDEPAAPTPARVPVQPLARSQRTSITDPGCD